MVTSRSTPLRICAFVVICGGIILCIVELSTIRHSPTFDAVVGAVALSIAYFLGGIGIGSALLGLHALLNRYGEPAGPQLHGAVADLSGQLEQLRDEFRGLALAAQTPAAPVESITQPDVESIQAPPAGASFTASAQITPELRQILDHMTQMLADIRDFGMMTEEQKQAVLWQDLQTRKQNTLIELRSLIEQRQFARADKLLTEMESQFAGDTEIRHSRWELTQSRDSAEAEAFTETRQRVEDFMSVSSWDQALSIATEYRNNFPRSPEGAALLERVMREREVAYESVAHRMYEEVLGEIDRRNWRRALIGGQRLVERFPDHRNAKRILSQINVLQANAEIEERQEQEMRIQELIRNKRFPEAIELADDLLERFPNSPQAESLRQLLPKIHDLAVRQVADSLPM